MAGMRRSEVSALRWADVAASAAGDGMLVTVRRGKTNPAGETKDVRFVKGDVARAESADVAVERGRLDAVIAGLLFMAGMRRSEVSALRWADVAASAAGDGMLVTVRRGKTNPAGETKDVRFVKDDVARALQTLRSASSPSPGDPVVPLSPQMVGLRFQSAARSAGVEPVTAHSGRVGLASKGSVRYKVANCTRAQPVFHRFGRLAHGKVISVSVLSVSGCTDGRLPASGIPRSG